MFARRESDCKLLVEAVADQVFGRQLKEPAGAAVGMGTALMGLDVRVSPEGPRTRCACAATLRGNSAHRSKSQPPLSSSVSCAIAMGMPAARAERNSDASCSVAAPPTNVSAER